MGVKIPKSKLWKAIRQHCLDCVCNSSKEIALCTGGNGYGNINKCKLYDYRFGKYLNETKLANTLKYYNELVTGNEVIKK